MPAQTPPSPFEGLGNLVNKIAADTAKNMNKWYYPVENNLAVDNLNAASGLADKLADLLLVYSLKNNKTVFQKASKNYSADLFSFESEEKREDFIKNLNGKTLYTEFTSDNDISSIILIFDHGFVLLNLYSNKEFEMNYSIMSTDPAFVTGNFTK